MAASLLIEQESGTYIGPIRHSHDGYFAGDFSQTSRWSSVPRTDAPHGAHPLATPPASHPRLSVAAHRLGTTLNSVEVIDAPL